MLADHSVNEIGTVSEVGGGDKKSPAVCWMQRRGQGPLGKNPRANAARGSSVPNSSFATQNGNGIKARAVLGLFPIPQAKVPTSHPASAQRNVPIPLRGRLVATARRQA